MLYPVFKGNTTVYVLLFASLASRYAHAARGAAVQHSRSVGVVQARMPAALGGPIAGVLLVQSWCRGFWFLLRFRIYVGHNQVDIELLTASPAANGFFGAGGVSGWIPAVYSLLEQAAWRRLTRLWARSAAAAGRARTPKRLLEYGRPGWEFHAKGIWCAPAAQWQPLPAQSGPFLQYTPARRTPSKLLVCVVARHVRCSLHGCGTLHCPRKIGKLGHRCAGSRVHIRNP